MRVQDGPKCELLCAECEDRVGEWEGEFAQKVFHPIHRNQLREVEYSKWMLKFAVSVSWRTLYHLCHHTDQPPLPFDHEQRARDAMEHWRRFLLGQEENPGPYQQHLAIAGRGTVIAGIPPGAVSRSYLETAVDWGTRHQGQEEGYVISKLGGIFICGVIHNTRTRWKGTLVRVNRGRYFSGGLVQVSDCIPDFIRDGLQSLDEAAAALSPRQHEKISENFRKRYGSRVPTRGEKQ